MPYNYARGRSLENRRESDKVRKKGFVVKHTLANKATGILLFLLPMAVLWEVIKVPYIVLVCLLATFAAVQEGHLIRTEQSS